MAGPSRNGSGSAPNARPAHLSPALVALLCRAPGACALVYQTVWLREFRLIFGASTSASAAVLAVFMGGLGVGGLVLGKRADRSTRPLLFYSHLELAIASIAGATPFVLSGVRSLYAALGGTTTLGSVGGTIVRILLSVAVLGVPTFLMGGTLPAAARAVEDAVDVRRRNLGILYAANTLGAVVGAAASTFALLEVFGARATLWLACLLNVLIAMTARPLARLQGEVSPSAKAEPGEPPSRGGSVPPLAVCVAAGGVGFAFLLMELVWYRMLAPLLGGSSYTFG